LRPARPMQPFYMCSTSSPDKQTTEAQGTDGAPGEDEGPPPHMSRIRSLYCKMCGKPMQLVQLPTADWRHRCTNQDECGFIDYVNPRMVVGAITEHEGRILLCRRAIEPCLGKWTVPAGFMELNESSAQGAARETMEEAGANVEIIAPYCHWDIPVIGQAYILFRAKLLAPFTIQSETAESLESQLFDPADIPFQDIAFSSVSLALRYYLEDVEAKKWRVHHGVIEKKLGSAPNDPSTFQIKDLMSMEVS